MLGEEGDRGDKNFLEWGGATLVGDNQVGCCDFGASGFDTRDCFLLWLSSSRLCSGCRISIRLLKPGRLPGGGHIRLLERLRDRLRRGILIWGGVLVALSKRPLARRDSTLRPGPSARQRFRPAKLSLRWGGLWRRYFGHARTLALLGPSSFLSTYYSPCSSLCGYHHSHRTEAAPPG